MVKREGGGGGGGETKGEKKLLRTRARWQGAPPTDCDRPSKSLEAFKTEVDISTDDVQEAERSPVEMRDVVTEATRKRGVFFKTFTVVVVICILCSQLFVVWKIQDKYRKGGTKGKGGSVDPGNAATSLYKSIKKVL